MNNLIHAVLIACFCVQGSTAVAAERCLRYEPAEATLSGVLVRRTYPGPPNFESVAQGDRPEAGYYLKLVSPVCVKAEEQDDGIDHENLREVQLALDHKQYATLRQKLGKQVSVTGTLFEAFNGHHHTPVLLSVNR